MTQQTNALSWQDQSDATQPLANYTLNFSLDALWQFNLSGMYHLNPISPAGVSIDNSEGAGTIAVQSAAFSVNILPFSREDIDLSNASQQVTFQFLPGTNPAVAPYVVPIVFWIKKPSGAQQNQLAINQAVQSAIVANVLGNMQPIINAGFTEKPTGGIFAAPAPAYTCLEGWMSQCATGGAVFFDQISPPLGVFGAPFYLQMKMQNLNASQVQWGTALTSADSAQFRGQQITLGFDLEKFFLVPGSTLNVSIISGRGTDENIFTPFTAASVLAVRSFNAATFQGRVSFSTPGTIPTNINQLGILFQYNPGAINFGDIVQIGRPQFDFGSIAQQFRTVPELMERDRCQSFFEVLNSEQRVNHGFASGVWQTPTNGSVWGTFKRKRAVPTLTFTGNFSGLGSGGFAAVNSFAVDNISPESFLVDAVITGPTTQGTGCVLFTSDGTAQIAVNARM